MNETTTTQDDKKLQRRAIGLAVSAAVGGFLFGFDSSVINGAVSAIQGRFELSETLIGFAVASALLGCALGAYLAGRIADRIGRRWTMIIGAGFFFISAFGSGYAFSVWDLTIWRVIGGLGIGIASVVAPAYIAEISQAPPWPPRVAAAARDHARHLHRPPLGRRVRRSGGQRVGGVLVRPRGLALGCSSSAPSPR